MRVKLKKPSEFFKVIIKGQSLRKFCLKNKITYSTAKQWNRGEHLIPKEIFDKLILKTKNKNYFLKDLEFIGDNWGRSKGGQAAKNIPRNKLLIRMKKMRDKYFKKVNIKINKRFLEFYGALMGDGCLSIINRSDGYKSYGIFFTGHKILDRKYHEYLVNIAKNEFNLDFKIKERKDINAIDTKIRNKDLLTKLANIGFPIGKKLGKLNIPKKFYKMGWENVKFVIRGLFDTDGCFSARKDEKYRYPIIAISNNDPKFIEELYQLLKNKGYPVWKSKYKKKLEIRLRGIKNTIKWMNDIGSSNDRHLSKYHYWLKNGVVPVVKRADNSVR